MGPAEQYRASFPPGEIGAFRIDALDRLGVPVVAADFLGVTEPGFSGFGYGADEAQALTGAYGEVAESVHLTASLRDAPVRRAAYDDLRRQLGADAVCDPRRLGLPAGSPYSPGLPLHWRPMTRWADGATVWVPADFVAARAVDLPGEPELITPITNGLGAGDTAERALAHALLELIQRDGNSVSYRALDEGRVIDVDAVADPLVTRLVAGYRDAGIDVLAKFAGAPLGIPSVYVVGADGDPATPPLAVTACGEAADPHLPTALAKALLEYAASRSRKVFAHGGWDLVETVAPEDYLRRELARPIPPQETRALEAMREWCAMSGTQLRDLLAPTVLSRRTGVAPADIPSTPTRSADPAGTLETVLGALDGFDVLVHLARAPGSDGEVCVVKAVVPGLEVETMSYGRIGPRGIARLLDRGSPLVSLGDRPGPSWAAVPLPAGAGEPAWLDLEGVQAAVGALYPLYREPTRHAVARLH